jgi:hypothetical protein
VIVLIERFVIYIGIYIEKHFLNEVNIHVYAKARVWHAQDVISVHPAQICFNQSRFYNSCDKTH